MCSIVCIYAVILCYFDSPATVTAGDIVHDDDSAPKKPGCENDFVLVKKPNFLFLFYSFVVYVFPCIFVHVMFNIC